MSCIVWNSDDSLESTDLIKKLFGTEEIEQEGKIFTGTFINRKLKCRRSDFLKILRDNFLIVR